MSAERQLRTVISMNVTMPHMGHISRAIEAESSPSPRGPNSSKSVKPFDERNQKELAYTKLTDPRKTETHRDRTARVMTGEGTTGPEEPKVANGKRTEHADSHNLDRTLGMPTPRRVSPNSSQHTPKNEDRPTDGEENGGKLGTTEEAKGESEPCEILREDLKAEAGFMPPGERLRIALAFPR